MIEYYKEQQIFSMADVIWMNGLEEATRQGATRQHGTRHKARGKRHEAIAAREREANRLWGRP